jgi:hypothetical protein
MTMARTITMRIKICKGHRAHVERGEIRIQFLDEKL